MNFHHYHRRHPRLRGVRLDTSAAPAFPAGSLSPAQVLTAYGFKQNQYKGALPMKLGIGSLGGGVVQQDIDNAVQLWGMAAPKLTIRTVAGATDNPSDQDSNVENMLDIQMMAFAWWWLTGTPADITITFGPNASGGMTAVTQDLVDVGVHVASWSWGSAAISWSAVERAGLGTTFAAAVAAGVTFCAAAGDNSIDDGTTTPTPDYPCADPNVWAVGGTNIGLNPDGTIAQESAWGDGAPGDEGGGGGFDSSQPSPSFQVGIVPIPHRGVPDTSANADPASGWQISANGSWTVVGGTSAASPFTAALIAVAKGIALAAGGKNLGLLTSAPYESAPAFNDITLGSNGDPAVHGWDPATGLGSPHGDGFIQALVAQLQGKTPPGPPPPAPYAGGGDPLPTTSPTATVMLAQAQAWGASELQSGFPLLTRAQAIAAQNAGLAKNWPSS